MNKMELREHALERAEFYHDLALKEAARGYASTVWEHTMYEWLFVYATGQYLS